DERSQRRGQRAADPARGRLGAGAPHRAARVRGDRRPGRQRPALPGGARPGGGGRVVTAAVERSVVAPAGVEPAGAALRRPAEREARRPLWQRVLFVAALVGAAVIFMLPFVWLISASLRPREYVFAPGFLPVPFAPENYAEAWRAVPLVTWL